MDNFYLRGVVSVLFGGSCFSNNMYSLGVVFFGNIQLMGVVSVNYNLFDGSCFS